MSRPAVFLLAHSAKTNSLFPLSVSVACLSGFLKNTADLKTESLKHSRPQTVVYEITETDGRNWLNTNLPECYVLTEYSPFLIPRKIFDKMIKN